MRRRSAALPLLCCAALMVCAAAAAAAQSAPFDNDNVVLGGSVLTLAEFTAFVDVGAQQLRFRVQVDTGSSLLAIPGVGCQTDSGNPCVTDPLVTLYDYTQSTSATLLAYTSGCTAVVNNQWCGYSSGYVGGTHSSGLIVEDVVQLGLASARVRFGVMLFQSDVFEPDGVSGIMGLALPDVPMTTDVFSALVTAGQVSNLFSMCLNAYSNSAPGGILTLGAAGQHHNATLSYLPSAMTSGLYTVTCVGLRVSGQTVVFGADAFGQTVVDSGTTELVLPTAVFGALVGYLRQFAPPLAQLDNLLAGNAVFLSDAEYAAYPSLEVVLSGYVLLVPPSQYLLATSFPQGNVYELLLGSLDPSLTGGVTTTILGDVAMRGYEVVFDRQNRRVGFAPVGDCEVKPFSSVRPSALPSETASSYAVTITGTSAFADNVGVSAVTLCGHAATILSQSTLVVVVRPASIAGSCTGSVDVTSSLGTFSLANGFTYFAASTRSIGSVSPASAGVSSTPMPYDVTITGVGLGAGGGDVSAVSLAGTNTTNVVSQAPGSVVVVAAPRTDNATGPVVVYSTLFGALTASAGVPVFQYNNVATLVDVFPLTAFTVASSDTRVTLIGHSLGAVAGVTLAGVPASVVQSSATQVVVVPGGALTAPPPGPVVVRLAGGAQLVFGASFAYSARLGPALISDVLPDTLPLAPLAGSRVTIVGAGFSATTTSVLLDGVPVSEVLTATFNEIVVVPAAFDASALQGARGVVVVSSDTSTSQSSSPGFRYLELCPSAYVPGWSLAVGCVGSLLLGALLGACLLRCHERRRARQQLDASAHSLRAKLRSDAVDL